MQPNGNSSAVGGAEPISYSGPLRPSNARPIGPRSAPNAAAEPSADESALVRPELGTVDNAQHVTIAAAELCAYADTLTGADSDANHGAVLGCRSDDAPAILRPFGCAIAAADGGAFVAAVPGPVIGTEPAALGEPKLRAEQQSHLGSVVHSDAAADDAAVAVIATAVALANDASNALPECLSHPLSFHVPDDGPEHSAFTDALDAAIRRTDCRAIGGGGLDDPPALFRPERATFFAPDSQPDVIAKQNVSSPPSSQNATCSPNTDRSASMARAPQLQCWACEPVLESLNRAVTATCCCLVHGSVLLSLLWQAECKADSLAECKSDSVADLRAIEKVRIRSGGTHAPLRSAPRVRPRIVALYQPDAGAIESADSAALFGRSLVRPCLLAWEPSSGSSILSALKDSEPGVCSTTPSRVVDLSTATTERCDFPLHAELGHRGYGHVGCVGCVSRTLAQ